MRRLVAWAGLAWLCGMSGPVVLAQRRPAKTLVAQPRATVSFADLIAAQTRVRLGSLEALAAITGAVALEPAVYVTITKGEIFVWDHRVLALAADGAPAASDLANCPPACLPRLRDAVAPQIGAELARLRRAGSDAPPRVLFLADVNLPYRTFLAAAYSVAYATDRGPARLALATRTGQAENPIGAMPFFLAPAHTVRIAENANPLYAHITLGPAGFVVRARKSWLPWAENGPSVDAIAKLLGELKARDPGKTVAFFSAPPETPLGKVIDMVAAIRQLYPDVTLGGMPKIVGPAE